MTSMFTFRKKAPLVDAERHDPAVAVMPASDNKSRTHPAIVAFAARRPVLEMNKAFSPGTRIGTE